MDTGTGLDKGQTFLAKMQKLKHPVALCLSALLKYDSGLQVDLVTKF